MWNNILGDVGYHNEMKLMNAIKNIPPESMKIFSGKVIPDFEIAKLNVSFQHK